MAKTIPQIFKELHAANGKRKELLAVLTNPQNVQSPGFLTILRGAFHPRIHYIFKEIIPYTAALKETPELGFTTIPNELKRVYIFEQDHPAVPKNLTFARKQQILIQMLEAMDKPDAEIFMNMLLKDLKVPGLTRKLVSETWPQLLS